MIYLSTVVATMFDDSQVKCLIFVRGIIGNKSPAIWWAQIYQSEIQHAANVGVKWRQTCNQ